MAQEKGIVLETRKRQCLVLTGKGEFCAVRRPPAPVTVGQEIEFTRPAASWRPLLAAACLVMFLTAGTLFASIYPAAGYVSVDINPSVELGLNAWGRVVRTTGLDADGRNLLKSMPLYGRPLNQALDDIVQKAQGLHYLQSDSPDNTVVVTYAPGRLTLVRPQERDLVYRTLDTQLKTMHMPARLLFAQVSSQERHQARRMGLSAGKYLVRENLQSRGLNVPAGEMAQTSIGKLLHGKKMNLGTISGPHISYWEVGTQPKAPGKTVQQTQVRGTPSVQPAQLRTEAVRPSSGSARTGQSRVKDQKAGGSHQTGRPTAVSGRTAKSEKTSTTGETPKTVETRKAVEIPTTGETPKTGETSKTGKTGGSQKQQVDRNRKSQSSTRKMPSSARKMPPPGKKIEMPPPGYAH